MDKLFRLKPEALSKIVETFVDTGQLIADWANYTEDTGQYCDLDLLKQLSSRAASLLKMEEMDPWLAPRLHCALRIPRRIAVDAAMWTWLALNCHQFIEARFRQPNRKIHPWRYYGGWSRNGLSRLWWGAEMTRNGASYEDVKHCFARTRTAQFALELMYSWHRPAAIAFCRVAEGVDGERLTDARTRTLSTRLRVLLSLQCLEATGSRTIDAEDEFDEDWAQHRPSLASLMGELGSLKGPSTGVCEEAAIDALAAWYREVLAMSGVEELAVDAAAERTDVSE